MVEVSIYGIMGEFFNKKINKTNLKQEWLLAFQNKIHAHKKFKRTFVYYDRHIFKCHFVAWQWGLPQKFADYVSVS